jgi:hypothetical protein
MTKVGNVHLKDGGVTATTKLGSYHRKQQHKQRWEDSVADTTPPETSPVTAALLVTTSISSTPTLDSSPVPPNDTRDTCLQDIPALMTPATPVHSQTDQVPCTITPKASQLFSAFALVRQYNLLFGATGSDSLSALSLKGASMVQMVVSGPSLPLALKSSSYPAVPHRNVPRNEEEDEALQNGSTASDKGNQGLLDTSGTSKLG